MRKSVAIGVVMLLAVGVGCRRKAEQAPQPPRAVAAREVVRQPVPRVLRAAVGRSLAVDANRLDPDVSIATLKPDIDDLDVVELVLSLEEVFGVNIEDEALVKVTGGTNGAIDGKKLTLRHLWQLVESARGSVKQSTGGSSGGLSRGSR
jgi:acyl carrier protein